jgi:hypothetical protein
MGETRNPSAPPLDLAAAFALLREAPAGDVPGANYSDALGRAARTLHDRTKPYQLRPPRAPRPAA